MMTTGEKLAVLRREKGLTQEQLAEALNVSRQSVSRWEMDAAFPETDKLIRLSRLLDCSIDFLLNSSMQTATAGPDSPTADMCFRFIRECGYFFLATCAQNKPRLRPMGMILSDGRSLYLATDKRKSVYHDLIVNPNVEVASYNLNTRKWLRVSGHVVPETSAAITEEMLSLYPMIRQEFVREDELNFVIFRLCIEQAAMS